MVRDIRSTPFRYGLALGAFANHPSFQSPIGTPQSGIMSAGCFPVPANKELDYVFPT